ncbi:MAG TPA: hypothetical protein VK699_00970 [Terriglobales bacterium]|nr:hypothetical protein [Terriglobales bacterium]
MWLQDTGAVFITNLPEEEFRPGPGLSTLKPVSGVPEVHQAVCADTITQVPSPLDIPPGIVDWVRSVFSQVNARSSATLSRIPNIFETTLDHSLIAHLSEFGAPFRFPSDWIVNLDTHFLGGRYWGHWEIADLGILVVFRRKGEMLGTKIALLQSKRLYPDEIENAVDMHPMDYETGFGRLLASDSEYKSQIKPRTFNFSEESKYRALAYRNNQYEGILKYSEEHGIPVHYLLYNPLTLPFSVELPAASGNEKVPELKVGCRVIKAETLNGKLGHLKDSQHPSFRDAAGNPMASDFWTLHNFVADMVMGCKEGYVGGTNPLHDPGLFRVFSLRGGPISAAISITIDAPSQ